VPKKGFLIIRETKKFYLLYSLIQLVEINRTRPFSQTLIPSTLKKRVEPLTVIVSLVAKFGATWSAFNYAAAGSLSGALIQSSTQIRARAKTLSLH